MRKLKSFTIEGKKVTSVRKLNKKESGLGFSNGSFYSFKIDGVKFLEGAENLDKLKKKIKNHV